MGGFGVLAGTGARASHRHTAAAGDMSGSSDASSISARVGSLGVVA